MKRLIITAAAALVATVALAQKGNIGFVYPAGAQKGTTVEVTVGGQNLSKAQSIVFSGKGVSGELIPAPKGQNQKKRKNKNIGEEDNLQLADQVKFRVTVDKAAEPGLRDVRLVLPNGMTNRLYFEVGELPDVLESPKAELSAKSETLPVTFNGQIMRSDRDRFRFHAKSGAQLVLQVKGRLFVPYMADAVPGWFQPIIRLYGPDGKEVAYSDDYQYEVDPVLFYKVETTGAYEVEINDALYRGREDFVYRIDVGELPFITSISPIGGPSGKKTTVQLNGFNLPKKTLTFTPKGSGKYPVSIVSKKGISSNTVFYESDARPQMDTRKLAPNNTMRDAWALEPGTVVEQTVSSALEQHWYKISVHDRKPLTFEAVSRRLGSPADMKITIFDDSGEKVGEADDLEDVSEYMMTHFADPQGVFNFRPGTYYVRLTEAQGNYGPDCSYRFFYDKSTPDFALSIEPATFSVPENGTGFFNVIATRKQKFRGAINLSLNGLPKGFKLSGNQIPQGQTKALISVTAPKGAEHQVVNPQLVGSADADGVAITRKGIPVESMMQAFYYTHLMPIDEFRMEVGEELPIKLNVRHEGRGKVRLSYEEPTRLKVHIDRNPGFDNPVTIMLRAVDARVKAEAVIVPEGESDAVLEVTVRKNQKNPKAMQRDFFTKIMVYGVVKGSSARIAGKGRNAYVASVTAYSPVFDVVIPGLKK